jgi:hypothetical protein
MSKEKKEQGAHDAGKPNAPREGDGYHCGRSVPKYEPVRTLSLENDNDDVRKDAVKGQNSSLLSDGSRVTNVTPNSGKSKLISVPPKA